MKKTFIISTGATLLLLATVVPQAAFAARPDFAGSDKKPARVDAAQFCSTIDAMANANNAKMTERMNRLNANRLEHTIKKDEKRTDRDEALEAKRENWDARRAERFSKLTGRAVTDEQRAAVEEFRATVTDALGDRRIAVDTAITEFRGDVDALSAAHKAALNEAITDLKEARDAAVAKAKADCAAGVDPVTAQATFEASMKAAMDAFMAAKENIKQPEMQTIIETRKTAVSRAMDEFQSVMRAAQEKLRLVFSAR